MSDMNEMGQNEMGQNEMSEEIQEMLKELGIAPGGDIMQMAPKVLSALKEGTTVTVHGKTIALDGRKVEKVFGITVTDMPSPADVEKMWNRQIDLEEAIIEDSTNEDTIRDLAICYTVMGDVIPSIINKVFGGDDRHFTAIVATIELARILGREDSDHLNEDDITHESMNNAMQVSNDRTMECAKALGFESTDEFFAAIK
jgi:hypothetical protein